MWKKERQRKKRMKEREQERKEEEIELGHARWRREREIMKGWRKERCTERHRTSRKPVRLI